MTNSSSKPLQTLGKWYQPRNPKKNPKPAQKKNPKTISHPYRNNRNKIRQWNSSTLLLPWEIDHVGHRISMVFGSTSWAGIYHDEKLRNCFYFEP
jgi:hypothetical protein